MAADATPLSEVRFLTVAEVAAIMRVSKMTVYRLVHSGELEAIRVGRSFRVPEEVRYGVGMCPGRRIWRAWRSDMPVSQEAIEGGLVGSVIKKRRKRMA